MWVWSACGKGSLLHGETLGYFNVHREHQFIKMSDYKSEKQNQHQRDRLLREEDRINKKNLNKDLSLFYFARIRSSRLWKEMAYRPLAGFGKREFCI